jgi:glutathione S-transferase
LAETVGRFQGPGPVARQAVREWLYWDADVLFPPIFNSYAVQLGQRKLLPIDVEPVIADYHRRRAEAALSVLDSHLARRGYLCAAEPTIADLCCYGDVAFAEICAFGVDRWTNVARWTKRVTALPGFAPPFELLAMENAELV